MEDYEKKYKEALERAKKWYYAPNADKMPTYANRIIKEIFPELKESEDEKIREMLIDSFTRADMGGEIYGKGVTYKQVIAWLEKQGTSVKLDEKEIQTAKDKMFPYQENVGRSYEQAWAASGFELGAHFVLNSLKNNGYSDEIYKQGEFGTFDAPQTPIKDAVEVTSRMPFISDDMKPIAEFIMGYANWDLHKDEWNQPTLTVPLFRVLDALIQRGKPYGECSQNIEKQGEQKPFDYEKATITQKDFAPKQEWSEEDENYLQSAENACEYQYGKNTSTILWLKSLKDRMKGKED